MSRIPTPTFARGGRLKASDLNALANAVPAIRGDGDALVSRSGSQVSVAGAVRTGPMFPVFFARIVSSSSLGGNRWRYQIEQIHKVDEGYALPSGYPNRPVTGSAYNMLELANSESGVQGNGVNVDDLPNGFSIGPIPSGEWPHPVFVWQLAGGGFEYWMHYPNPVVGRCPA